MVSGNRVNVARLARMLVLGPLGENFGRVRDVVISIGIVRQQPRVLGLVVDLATRRSIFIPILRVAAIEPNAATLNTGNVSLRRFEQRPRTPRLPRPWPGRAIPTSPPRCRPWCS
jgi:Mg/Co/Ni transporter MgtE